MFLIEVCHKGGATDRQLHCVYERNRERQSEREIKPEGMNVLHAALQSKKAFILRNLTVFLL